MTPVDRKPFPDPEIAALNEKFAKASPQEVLEWALGRFGDRLALAWSGAEDVAVVDMMHRIDPKCRVFTLDTGRLNPETHDVMQAVRKKYGIDLEILFPDREEVEKMVRGKGINLFYDSLENRKKCCSVRKVNPLNRILGTLDGWVTGLRRSQSVTRGAVNKIERDDSHGGIVKVNPLADWTTEQTFDYIREHDVPKNALHDRGYPSIGCAPCTRAVKPGEDERSGRWWWEEPEVKECGLHFPQKEPPKKKD